MQQINPKPTMEGNRFSIKLFILAFVFTGAVLAWLSWSTYGLYADDAVIKGQVWRTEELRGTIIHLDEVLTMSARMAAATGEQQWEARYRRFEPQLDKAIKEILELAPSQTLAQTDAANMRLVEMENHAFTLVRENKTAEAGAILFSQQYEMQKGIYALGMTSFFEQLHFQLEATRRSQRRRARFTVGASVVVLATLLFSWLGILRRMYKSHALLLISITRRQQTEEVLRKAQRELEVRVQERTSELTIANTSLREQISDRRRREKERQAISEVIASVGQTSNLNSLFENVHRSLSSVVDARNCFVALYDNKTEFFEMKFFVDEYDQVPPPQKLVKSRAAYVFRTGQPMLMTQETFQRLVKAGEVENGGTPSGIMVRRARGDAFRRNWRARCAALYER